MALALHLAPVHGYLSRADGLLRELTTTVASTADNGFRWNGGDAGHTKAQQLGLAAYESVLEGVNELSPTGQNRVFASDGLLKDMRAIADALGSDTLTAGQAHDIIASPGTNLVDAARQRIHSAQAIIERRIGSEMAEHGVQGTMQGVLDGGRRQADSLLG